MKGKLKGDTLKGAACYRFSFSKEQRRMLHDFCEQLGLSASSEGMAKEIYKNFLKRTLNITITPKSAICASIYIAAILHEEHRAQPQFRQLFNISEFTLRKWWHFVAEVVEADHIAMFEHLLKKKG